MFPHCFLKAVVGRNMLERNTEQKQSNETAAMLISAPGPAAQDNSHYNPSPKVRSDFAAIGLGCLKPRLEWLFGFQHALSCLAGGR